MPRNHQGLSNSSGYFGLDDAQKDQGQKSLNDKLRETFNLQETASGQLPGIDDHSPSSIRRHYYFNNIISGSNANNHSNTK